MSETKRENRDLSKTKNDQKVKRIERWPEEIRKRLEASKPPPKL